MVDWDTIELGFERLLALIAADERVGAEFERSRGEFFADAASARGPGAERRHLEWFLLERPSVALGGVPAHVWQEELRAASVADAELATSFLQSLAGAFEVTSVVSGEGLWLRDLFTQGEHPVEEAAATVELEVGDLLVGRLFPAGRGTYLLSPAVSVFRNPALLAAVRTDLEGMRKVRRGVLRIQQLELEHLFHSSSADAASVPSSPPDETRSRVRAGLGALGLDEPRLERTMRAVRDAARSGDGRAITEILNALAFETGVDLEAARLVLADLWEAERAEHAPASAPRDEPARDAHAALEAFDRGRAEGKDLELLFRELERDLGVDEDLGDDGEEDPGAPDFPGVVGAMVEEFLWDAERELGPERASAWTVLRALGDYGRDIGLFDELDRAHLLDFAARWALDEGGATRAADAERLLDALAAFIAWCEERHDVPLRSAFGPTLDALRPSLPRHAELRRAGARGGRGAHRVAGVAPGAARVLDADGNELTVPLSRDQAAWLAEGDVVRLAVDAERGWSLGATYPAELAGMLGR